MADNHTSIQKLVEEHAAMKSGSGAMGKELDMPSKSSAERQEVIKLSEMEAKNSPEHEQMTSKSHETIQLPPSLKKIGVKAADEEEKMFQEALNKIKLPISDERIMQDLAAPPSESKRWYATFFMYILERAHMTLKKVGTKVVRVFKTD